MTPSGATSRGDRATHVERASTARHDQQRAALARCARDVRNLRMRLHAAEAAQRECVTRQVRENGWPIELAAEAAGVDLDTARKWIR
jgi:hypothetical protein